MKKFLIGFVTLIFVGIIGCSSTPTEPTVPTPTPTSTPTMAPTQTPYVVTATPTPTITPTLTPTLPVNPPVFNIVGACDPWNKWTPLWTVTNTGGDTLHPLSYWVYMGTVQLAASGFLLPNGATTNIGSFLVGTHDPHYTLKIKYDSIEVNNTVDCSAGIPTPTPIASPTPTATFAPTSTPTPIFTPTRTPTPTPPPGSTPTPCPPGPGGGCG